MRSGHRWITNPEWNQSHPKWSPSRNIPTYVCERCGATSGNMSSLPAPAEPVRRSERGGFVLQYKVRDGTGLDNASWYGPYSGPLMSCTEATLASVHEE